MRARALQFVVLLLLVSSLAGTDAFSKGMEHTRTPGGVFVRDMLLKAAVEDSEASAPDLPGDEAQGKSFRVRSSSMDLREIHGPVAQAAQMHSVTGSSL